MALNYSGFTYQGDVAKTWYTTFLQDAPSFDLLNQLLNVKDKRQLPSLEMDDVLQGDSCDWNDGTDVTVSTKSIITTPMMVMIPICHNDLENWFISADTPDGADNVELPVELANIIMTRIKEKVALGVERLIWRGDTASGTASLAHFDGLEKLLKADPDVQQINSTPLNAANILPELDKIIAAVATYIPVMLDKLENAKVGIALSPSAMQFYFQAQTNLNLTGAQYQMPANGVLTYMRFKLFQVTGISANTMCFADFDRVYFGTDLMSDMDSIKILNMLNTTAERKFRISARLKAGVQYAVGAEMVLYRPA